MCTRRFCTDSIFSGQAVAANADSIVDRHFMRPMREAVASLNELVIEWNDVGQIREVDWGRMRSLDFQENLRARDRLAKELPSKACLLCGDFKDHVRRML